MSYYKRTPGPWRIEDQDIYGDDKNGYICTWSGYSVDAHLIAAAPDLLEALELAQALGILEAPADESVSNREFRTAAKAAIAKARGES